MPSSSIRGGGTPPAGVTSSSAGWASVSSPPATSGHPGATPTGSATTWATTLCTSWAGYGSKPAYAGHIESMHVCAWDSLGTVRAGEVLDLEAVYNAAEPVDDVMGIMVVHVWETPDLYGGTVPPPEVSGDVRP